MSSKSSEELLTKTGGKPASKGVIKGKYSLSVGMPETVPPKGWHWVSLSNIARLETGHTPSRKHPEYWGGEVPWIGIRDATGNHGTTIFDTQQHTNDLGIRNSSARVLPAHTVCLSRTASVGYVVVMGCPMATSQDFVNWVCSEAIDYRFLKYILLSEHDSMLRFSSGTTHQTIYFPEAKAFHVCIPEIGVQRGIADVLQSLDDRIASLRETNSTLEAITQALFKSWFVDFDPVRAKMEGRLPAGMDESTAALFPDRFEESELGVMPKGWSVGTLGDVTHTIKKQIQPSELHAGLNYVGLEHIPRKSLSLADWDSAEGLESAKAAFGTGDILFGKLRPYFHKVVVAPFDGVCSTDILVCNAKKPAYYGFSVMQLFSTSLIDYAERLSNGAKMPRVGWKDLADYKTVIPAEPIAAEYTRCIEAQLARMKANVHASQTLAALRDTLLPRLISGQLRLPEAEAQIEGLAA